MGKIKALGLALVAVLAIGALGASGASAANFYSSHEETELAGTQLGVNEFVINTGVIVCEVAHFTGEVVGEEVGEGEYVSETVPLHPEYSGCEFEELFEITLNTSGCDYVLAADSATDGTFSIECEGEGYIQFGSVFTCRVRWPSQENLATITFEAVEQYIKITAEITGIEYTESGLFCSGSGGVNGTYVGLITIEGNGGAAKLWVS